MRNFICLLLSLWITAQMTAQGGGIFDQKNISIQNIYRLNSNQSDFSPAYYQNGIVFVSNRLSEVPKPKIGRKDQRINDTFFALYSSQQEEGGEMSQPKQFLVDLTSKYHEGPVCFSKDGQQIFYTQNTLVKDRSRRKYERKLNIIRAEKEGDKWVKPTRLSFNNDDINDKHPTLSTDGKTLIFASDRAGGFGGTDLYKSELVNNRWSTPVNLGDKVNTPDDEAFPFLHEDGILYFASKGRGGEGGFDMFYVAVSKTQVGTPVSVGVPMNSDKDDFGLILNPEKTAGYFSSARMNGQGKDDIYYFMLHSSEETVETPVMLETDICVYDQATEERLSNVLVKITKQRPDGTLESFSKNQLTIMEPVPNSDDYVLKSEAPQAGKIYENRYYKTDADGSLQTFLLPNENYVLFVENADYQPVKKMLDTKELTHSGDLSFCIPIVKNGRITRNGRINSRPTTNCFALEGMTLNESTGAILPNAELNLINNCSGESFKTYSNAQGTFIFSCQPLNCDYTLITSKEGYGQVSQVLDESYFANNEATDNHLVRLPISYESTTRITDDYSSDSFFEEAPSTSLSVGTSLVLEDLYYDYNDYHILPEAAAVLDKLVDFMRQHPSMEIELSAHTDSRGNAAWNQRLSRKRAEYAIIYLRKKGISYNRLKYKGYGESQLRNECQDDVPCSESEHRYNRRTEIKILRLDETNATIQYSGKRS